MKKEKNKNEINEPCRIKCRINRIRESNDGNFKFQQK